MAKLSALGAVPGGLQAGDQVYVVRGDGGSPEVFTSYRAEVDDIVRKVIIIAVSDETTSLTTGTAKLTFRMPFAMTVTEVRGSLTTPSSSGNVTVDVNEAGSTILSTKLTINAGEKTSLAGGTTQPVISDASLADDSEIAIDIDAAGSSATGLKVTLIGKPA